MAKEPHVVDVLPTLNSMGEPNIGRAGTDVIKIRGVQRLHSTEYSPPDQTRPGHSYAAAATKGDVTVFKCNSEASEATIAKTGGDRMRSGR